MIECILTLIKTILRAQIAYALSLWEPTEQQLNTLQSIMLLPMRRCMMLPISAPRCAQLCESSLPSLHTYRQYLIIKLQQRISNLSLTHHTIPLSYFTQQSTQALTDWNIQLSTLSTIDIKKQLHVQREKEWSESTNAEFMHNILNVHTNPTGKVHHICIMIIKQQQHIDVDYV